MKRKTTKQLRANEFEEDEFTPTFYLAAAMMVVGMITTLVVFVGLVVGGAMLLTGNL